MNAFTPSSLVMASAEHQDPVRPYRFPHLPSAGQAVSAPDPQQAWQQGFDQGQEQGYRVGHEAGREAVTGDIVVTGNSGYPLDQNLYQAPKAVATAEVCAATHRWASALRSKCRACSRPEESRYRARHRPDFSRETLPAMRSGGVIGA